MDFSGLFSIIKEYGIIPAIILFSILVVIWLVRIIIDEDRSTKFRALFYKTVFSLSGKRDHEKKYIANDINSLINIARKKLHLGRDILPKAVRVEWIKDDNEGTYDLKEGEFVVKLNSSFSQQKNIVRLASLVVERTSLTGIRHVVTEPMAKAMDLTLIKKLLIQINNKSAIDWFYSTVYQPAIKDDAQFHKWNTEIVEIDEKGMFTRILLVELEDFAKRIMGLEPRPYQINHVEELIHFLYKIATKHYGQDVPLTFIRAHIKTGVILIAKTSKILLEGITPYVDAMNYSVQQNLHSVYVIIFDKHSLGEYNPEAFEAFKNVTKSLENEFKQKSSIKKHFKITYTCIDSDGRSRKATCIRYLIEK